MDIFITATDTNVGKSYVSKGIVEELTKRNIKVSYFKPFQSGLVENEPTDAEIVQNGKNITVKNSYITATPCTPSVSADIDNIQIDLNKVLDDYHKLKTISDIVITEGSGGLFVPVTKSILMSDVIKKMDLPVIIVARPDLGTINHTLLTVEALQKRNIKIIGIVISNYPKDTNDPAITTACGLIEKFSAVKVIDIINHNENNFSKIADIILNSKKSL